MSEAQLGIFDDLPFFRAEPPRARRVDPATSHAAAASAKQLQADHHCLILGALKRGPAGVDRIAAITRLVNHAVGRRMNELQRNGAIELTGETVKSTAGRDQREWRLTCPSNQSA